MESTRMDTPGADRCARLRWKGLYVEIVPDSAALGAGDRLFWCNRTQTCLGPDGNAVEEGGCTNARSCYEKL